MEKKTVLIKVDEFKSVIPANAISVNTKFYYPLESVYVLTEQELEKIILKAWKQSRDGIIPTQTVNNILTNK